MSAQAPLHGAVTAEDGTCVRVTYLDEEGTVRHAEWRTDEPLRLVSKRFPGFKGWLREILAKANCEMLSMRVVMPKDMKPIDTKGTKIGLAWGHTDGKELPEGGEEEEEVPG